MPCQRLGRNGFGIAAVDDTPSRSAAGLLGMVDLGATATLDLTANGAEVPSHNAGDLTAVLCWALTWLWIWYRSSRLGCLYIGQLQFDG
jgi:hypothetical protein